MTIGIIIYLLFATCMLYMFYKKVIQALQRKSAHQYRKQLHTIDHSVSGEYEATSLLTKYEYKNYLGMRSYATAHGLIICPKIRLADLVKVKNDCNGYTRQRRFNRICAKHVDFVFCDPDMNVKLIVELDDSSHNRADRQERDKFVDAVLTGAGYAIVHIHAFDDAGVAALDQILGPITPEPPKEPVIKLVRNGPTYEEWKEMKLRKETDS